MCPTLSEIHPKCADPECGVCYRVSIGGGKDGNCPKCGHLLIRRYDDSAYEWGWGGRRAPWDDGSYDLNCPVCDWLWDPSERKPRKVIN